MDVKVATKQQLGVGPIQCYFSMNLVARQIAAKTWKTASVKYNYKEQQHSHKNLRVQNWCTFEGDNAAETSWREVWLAKRLILALAENFWASFLCIVDVRRKNWVISNDERFRFQWWDRNDFTEVQVCSDLVKIPVEPRNVTNRLPDLSLARFNQILLKFFLKNLQHFVETHDRFGLYFLVGHGSVEKFQVYLLIFDQYFLHKMMKIL